jgi:hypothetical protein
MRTIPESRSTIVFWEELTFTEAALLADEETQPLAPPVTACINQFMPTLQRDLDTRRTTIQSSARNSVADLRIDLGLRGLHADTLHMVRQNRQHPAFTALFSTHIGAVVRHALKRQIEVAQDLVTKLALPHYTPEFRSGQVARLQPLIARGAAVIEEQRQAELARAGGRIDVRQWKQEANAVRLSVYAALLALAAQHGRGRAWAEAFFKQKSAASERYEGDEPPVDDGERPDEA